MEQKELTINEAIGEARRALRLLDAFRGIEKVLKAVEDESKIRDEIQKEISAGNTILAELHEKVETAEKTLRSKVEEKEATVKDTEALIRTAREEYKKIVEDARREASKQSDGLESKIASLTNEIGDLQRRKEKAQAEAIETEARLSTLRKETEKQREFLLKVLG